MSNIKFHKVVGSLPGTLEANSVYFVRTGLGFSIHLTNDLGEVNSYNLNQDASSTPSKVGFYEFIFNGDNPDIINKWDTSSKVTLYKSIAFTWVNALPTQIVITEYPSITITTFSFTWSGDIISSLEVV
jgi:hypothetical protein